MFWMANLAHAHVIMYEVPNNPWNWVLLSPSDRWYWGPEKLKIKQLPTERKQKKHSWCQGWDSESLLIPMFEGRKERKCWCCPFLWVLWQQKSKARSWGYGCYISDSQSLLYIRITWESFKPSLGLGHTPNQWYHSDLGGKFLSSPGIFNVQQSLGTTDLHASFPCLPSGLWDNDVKN